MFNVEAYCLMFAASLWQLKLAVCIVSSSNWSFMPLPAVSRYPRHVVSRYPGHVGHISPKWMQCSTR